MNENNKTTFDHPAANLNEKKSIVFTAMSKKYFYMRMLVVKYVLGKGCVPINPFMSFDYFLVDTVDRDIVRNANNNLVDIADELWVFGSVSNGVLVEIKRVMQQGKSVRFFAVTNDREISEISKEQLAFEDGMEQYGNDF
jgi:hypothetical protein